MHVESIAGNHAGDQQRPRGVSIRERQRRNFAGRRRPGAKPAAAHRHGSERHAVRQQPQPAQLAATDAGRGVGHFRHSARQRIVGKPGQLSAQRLQHHRIRLPASFRRFSRWKGSARSTLLPAALRRSSERDRPARLASTPKMAPTSSITRRPTLSPASTSSKVCAWETGIRDLAFPGPIVRGRAWFSDTFDSEYTQSLVTGLPSGQNTRSGWAGSNLLHAQVNLTPSNILFADFLVNVDNQGRVGLGPLNPIPDHVQSAHARIFHQCQGSEIFRPRRAGRIRLRAQRFFQRANSAGRQLVRHFPDWQHREIIF